MVKETDGALGEIPTTGISDYHRAATDVSDPSNIKVCSPVIDAEAEEYARLKRRYSDLICEWSRVGEEFEDKKREARREIEEEMDTLRARIKILGPKPVCFGVLNDLDLPECESCCFGALCYRAMKSRGNI